MVQSGCEQAKLATKRKQKTLFHVQAMPLQRVMQTNLRALAAALERTTAVAAAAKRERLPSVWRLVCSEAI